MFDKEEIIKISIDYCQKLLTNREPKSEYLNDLRFENLVHASRMKVATNNDEPQTIDGMVKQQ